VSLEELREQHTEDINAGNKAQQRLQLRNLRSFAIRQMEEIRDKWREKKEVIINGVKKRLQFK
jgi:ribosomal protein L10